MSNLIEYVYKANDKINVKLANTGDEVKVITLNEVDSVVDLYRQVYEELKQTNCEKFIHPLEKQDVEELVTSEDSVVLGYYKEGKHLAGAVYTKPFSKDSKFFQTPVYEEGKTSYCIGGLVVDPKFRGNGVVGKMANVAYNGVKDYALSHPESEICGTGFEISCENFSSLSSLGGAKDENMQNIFNLVGIHYLADEKAPDSDLTVLGYASFTKQAQKQDTLPQATLNGNQQQSFETLDNAVQEIGLASQEGVTVTQIDGHCVEVLNSYVDAPIKSIIGFESNVSTLQAPMPSVLETVQPCAVACEQ